MVTHTLTARQLDRLRDDGIPTQVVDVRSPGEYAAGHIPGAINLPLEEIVLRQGEFDIRQRVVVVCKSGGRAALACERLPISGLDAWQLNGGLAG
jgi:rhodanese-related sulfurtransferase